MTVLAQTDPATSAARLPAVMDGLLAMIERETELVRAGKLTEAAALAEPKAELSRQYLALAQSLKNSEAGGAHGAPGELEALRRRHDLFQALLQVNLTVLATAHAVSEGILRGVHEELTRKAAPSTYGASGMPSTPPASVAQPLTVSRIL